MKKPKSNQSALSVLKRITHQEGLLAQAELFESMRKLRQAETERDMLNQRLDQHHQTLADSWRLRATQALITSLSTASYRGWLKGEIAGAKSTAAAAGVEADTAKEREAQLRAEGRLLDELISRRTERDAKELERQVFKETDEMVLLRMKTKNHDQL